ncbi:MAG: FKBP-type peptidyl-prolyl cis-trans isomerase [Bacteroidales bacterium]|jgi:FKBP-type peptidyl-prolyl cis-trans isomerase SlyD|nr:FKBP-type peptidyl-prolyl cis-trans isomerase [Bacteroidales bacterium]
MNISKNKVVSLSYELRLDGKDGEIIETVGADRPLVFIFGTDSLVPGFERNIENLKIGDHFAFLLGCEEAYGPALEEAMVEIPKTSFIVDGEIDNDMLFEGNTIPMTDLQGNRLSGVIAEIKTDSVMVDFNHPLAGDDLFFAGAVVGVREATAEELAQRHIHADCSSGDCGGCSGCCG